MGIQLPVGADDSRFRRADLAADMQGSAHAAQRACLGVGRPDNVEIDLAGGVAASGGQQGVQCEVQQGRVPATMHRTQRVVVLELRRRLKDGTPVSQFDQLAVEGVGHVGMGQVAFEQGGHHLQACPALNLVKLGQTGMPPASFEPALPDLRQLRLPGVQRGLDCVLDRHGKFIRWVAVQDQSLMRRPPRNRCSRPARGLRWMC
jgi:hypothetical protein